MNILLYNPDNGVTRNFMPHLWMFLLQALTPARPRSGTDRRQRAAQWMKKVSRGTCVNTTSDWLASAR